MIRCLDAPASDHKARSRRRVSGIWQAIVGWRALSRQRGNLARLDDHMLCDIGVSRHAAMTESCRPFWDAPDHWYDRRRRNS